MRHTHTSINIYIYKCTHIYIYTHISTHTYLFICIYIYPYTSICMHLYLHTHILHIYKHIYTCLYIYIAIHKVDIYIHVDIYMYTHTFIYTLSEMFYWFGCFLTDRYLRNFSAFENGTRCNPLRWEELMNLWRVHSSRLLSSFRELTCILFHHFFTNVLFATSFIGLLKTSIDNQILCQCVEELLQKCNGKKTYHFLLCSKMS